MNEEYDDRKPTPDNDKTQKALSSGDLPSAESNANIADSNSPGSGRADSNAAISQPPDPGATDPGATDPGATLPHNPPSAESASGGPQEPVTTEIVYSPVAIVVNPQEYFKPSHLVKAPNIAEDLQAIAAGGGAVGATALGVMSIAGSFITNWSIINGLLGIALGLWGLSSRRRRLAWIGLVLCLIGSLLSFASISEVVSDWMKVDYEQ